MVAPTMITILILVAGGCALGLGIGVIIGYVLGERAGARKAQRGFPVSQSEPTDQTRV